jgi:CRAL/TRIO domain
MPKHTSEITPRVLLFHMPEKDFQDFDIINILKVSFTTMQLLMENDDQISIVNPYVIFDCKNVSISNAMQFTPSMSKKLIFFIKKTYPNFAKGVFYINVSSFVEKIVNTLIVPFLKEKGKNIVRFQIEIFLFLHKKINFFLDVLDLCLWRKL